MSLPHNIKLTAYSRKLRNHSTLAEVLLWQQLKGRQLLNYKFRRQTPIGKYIVDFFCHELMLTIEIDGSTHIQNEEYDAKRQKVLEGLGIRFLRFNDSQVKKNIEGVLEEIRMWILKNGS